MAKGIKREGNIEKKWSGGSERLKGQRIRNDKRKYEIRIEV